MSIAEEAEKLITKWYTDSSVDRHDYHDLEHTREVVQYSQSIGKEEG